MSQSTPDTGKTIESGFHLDARLLRRGVQMKPCRLTFFSDHIYQDVDHYKRSCPADPRAEEQHRQSESTCFLCAHVFSLFQRFNGSFISVCDRCVYLQCTAMGPASSMLSCFRLTSSKKSSTPPGSVGTPWSGQALKWYCQTVRSVLP